MPSPAEDYVESLSPWPAEFGLDRMRELLAELGNPQLAYPSVHVVGTNGKSTTTRMIETLLLGAGLEVGAYLSPHVTGWAERIRVRGEHADFGSAIERVRATAEQLGATQFELLTAAALSEFAVAGVDAAVVEAGLGGRLDATNVLRAPVVVLTSVALDHTQVLGSTREAIAAEKLAVVQEGATVVLSEPEWEELARSSGAGRVVVTARSNLALAVTAATEFLGRDVDPKPAQDVQLPGRVEQRGEHPLELWDGAHNMAGIGWLLPRLPTRDWTLLVSVLADKNVDGMLEALSVLGRTLVATTSRNTRALPAEELAERAARFFAHVESEPAADAALGRARELAGPDGAVLVTGSLYLLADLAQVRV